MTGQKAIALFQVRVSAILTGETVEMTRVDGIQIDWKMQPAESSQDPIWGLSKGETLRMTPGFLPEQQEEQSFNWQFAEDQKRSKTAIERI